MLDIKSAARVRWEKKWSTRKRLARVSLANDGCDDFSLDDHAPDYSSHTKPDEEEAIPFDAGSSEAWATMRAQISDMSNSQIEIVWESLKHYDPRMYHDKSGGIGKNGWCYAIDCEMIKRGL